MCQKVIMLQCDGLIQRNSLKARKARYSSFFFFFFLNDNTNTFVSVLKLIS